MKLDAPLRTKESFHNKEDTPHHKGTSVLDTMLYFNMIEGFPLDYMHLTTVGVMKRILSRLMKSKPNQKKVHWSVNRKNILENSLQKMSKAIPCEFNRKLESGLQHYSRWKATELRLFMLYVSIGLFHDKKVMDREHYNNYLLFSLSMRYLLSDDMEDNINVVRTMLKNFIKGCMKIYGKDFISYNVHSLCHLPDDYATYGNLERVSCFQFESFLGNHIKGAVKSGYKPINQIASHIEYHNKLKIEGLKKIGASGFVNKIKRAKFFRRFTTEKYTLKVEDSISRDNCIRRDSSNHKHPHIQSNGDVAIVKKIFCRHDTYYFLVQTFENRIPLFTAPLNSEDIGISKVHNLGPMKEIPFSSSIKKIVLLPIKFKYLAIDLLHM